MTDRIPEYYRNLAQQESNDTSDDPPEESHDQPGEQESESASTAERTPKRYRADAFHVELPEGEWRDRTVYTLRGPTVDGMQHEITITTTESTGSESLASYAEQQIDAVQSNLSGAHVLRADTVSLACGRPAHRAIFLWKPDEMRRYLEQLYVRGSSKWYHISAVFTRSSRKAIGASVEEMMLSFTPRSEEDSGERSRALFKTHQ